MHGGNEGDLLKIRPKVRESNLEHRAYLLANLLRAYEANRCEDINNLYQHKRTVIKGRYIAPNLSQVGSGSTITVCTLFHFGTLEVMESRARTCRDGAKFSAFTRLAKFMISFLARNGRNIKKKKSTLLR